MWKFFDAILRATGAISAGLAALVTLLLLYEVVTRYFFRSPSIWALDFTMYAICYLTFLGGAWLLRDDGHVKVEIVTVHLKPRARRMLGIATSLIAFASCAIFFWQAVKLTLSAYREGQFIDGSIVVPRHLILGIIPLGMFLLCLEFLRKAWLQLRALSGGKEEPKMVREVSEFE